jgi:hypothetical protein
MIESLATLQRQREVAVELARNPVIAAANEQRRRDAWARHKAAEAAVASEPADARAAAEREFDESFAEVCRLEGMPNTRDRALVFGGPFVAFVTGTQPPEFAAQVEMQQRQLRAFPSSPTAWGQAAVANTAGPRHVPAGGRR